MARWLICLVAGLLFTCADRTFDNPYDKQVSKESWTPQNLEIQVTGLNSIMLTWTQPESRIDGFILTKKINGDIQEFNLGKSDFSFEDDVVNPDLQTKRKAEYFLKAKAGTLFSNEVKTEVEFP